MTDGNNGVDSTATVTRRFREGRAAAGAQRRSARGARCRPAYLVAWRGTRELAELGICPSMSGRRGRDFSNYVDCTNGDRTIVSRPHRERDRSPPTRAAGAPSSFLGASDARLAPTKDRWRVHGERENTGVVRRPALRCPEAVRGGVENSRPERDRRVPHRSGSTERSRPGPLDDDHAHSTVDTVTCNGPGTRSRPTSPRPTNRVTAPTCGKHSSARAADRGLAITATAFYRVTWSVAGAPGGGSFGLLPSAPRTVRVTVAEIQTVARAQG